MKILVIVNESPWGGSLGLTALRMACALAASGSLLAGIYFRNDGVYHAIQGQRSDSGTPDLHDAWLDLARRNDVPLLLCSSAVQRRFPASPGRGFRETGLAEALALAADCDRVVTF